MHQNEKNKDYVDKQQYDRAGVQNGILRPRRNNMGMATLRQIVSKDPIS